MRATRHLPIATEQRLSDRYADRRIWNIDEVGIGQKVEQIATGRIVTVLDKRHDWLEVRRARGQAFIRKVSCFARLEAVAA
ncbi:MAG: hypothetical protein QOH63_1928 [Acidobacteriota bacterium]|jgi:hypothetical protein|nr:hypothetical protein [Acidobacteriota bacterium]